jgi:adenylosuccinate lyase
MIPRYSRPEMVALWQPATRFQIWFDIEAHAADAMAELGVIPKAAAQTIWAKAPKAYDDAAVARIDEIERDDQARRDRVSHLCHRGKWARRRASCTKGMTSPPTCSTPHSPCSSTRASGYAAGTDIDRVLAALKKRALMRRKTWCAMGRSHGIHAEPVTIGLKFARFYAEFARNRERTFGERAARKLRPARSPARWAPSRMSTRAWKKHVAATRWDWPVEPVSTQVIPRDRHAMFFRDARRHCLVASRISRQKSAIMQRTEVLEAEEFFSAGQKGSQRDAA